ncbi:MAG: carbon-nitrogen hydrolase family protein [Methanomassiliicoccales archaeon]|nr:carbon-nitrogen hydrolase family protein [Methanomassiliicoccales archaeon]
MKIGLLQLYEEHCSDGLRRIEDMLKLETDLLILPEKWMPLKEENIVHGDRHPFLDGVSALSSDYGAAVLTGALYEKDGGCMYITCYAYGPDGGLLAKQRKIHLFLAEKDSFRPGESINSFSFSGAKIGMAVCYDIDFPETVRKYALADCDLLAVPAKIIKQGMDPWMLYVRTRVLENRMPVAFSNCAYGKYFNGGSALVDLVESKEGHIMYSRVRSIRDGENAAVFDFAPGELREARRIRLSDRNASVDALASDYANPPDNSSPQK